MNKQRLFLASSSELREDREHFEIFIGRENKKWFDRGVFFHLDIWEDFLDSMSRTRLQDEYNNAIEQCDIFVMLYCTKVGKYTHEEFDKAFGQFQATSKPFIHTYFNDSEDRRSNASPEDLLSLHTFQEKLRDLGHYQTVYRNIDQLKLHFGNQLEKLAAADFIEFPRNPDEEAQQLVEIDQASAEQGAAIAQGEGATAVAAGGVYIGGNNSGDVNTGSKVTVDPTPRRGRRKGR